MIDYILVADRWKNTIKNCEADVVADSETRHKPLWATLKINFGHTPNTEPPRQERIKYKECSIDERLQYNQALCEQLEGNWSYEQVREHMGSIAEKHLPKKTRQPKQDYASKQTEQLSRHLG